MKPGDVVRLKGFKRRAVIEIMLSDIEGGVKLDRPLNGFRYWNVLDLVLSPGSPPRQPSRAASTRSA
jgi:hypothetical protein